MNAYTHLYLFLHFAEDAADHEIVPVTSLTSYNFSTCVCFRVFLLSFLERCDSNGSKRERRVNRPFVSPWTFEASFVGQTARGSFSLSNSLVFPSNEKTRARGRVGEKRVEGAGDFYLLLNGGLWLFFAGSRPANKRSFASREL